MKNFLIICLFILIGAAAATGFIYKNEINAFFNKNNTNNEQEQKQENKQEAEENTSSASITIFSDGSTKLN